MAAAQGIMDLVIVQATPLCNIDCAYCYLPNRDNSRRISTEVIAAAFSQIFQSELCSHVISVVWHAGEPTLLPTEFYADHFRTIDVLRQRFAPQVRIIHEFQTNGLRLDQRWCDFLAEHACKIGVSFDGPQWIHDAHRPKADGKGTYERVIQSLALLRANRLEYSVITVVCGDSLDRPGDVFQAYIDQSIRYVGFNLEEVTGAHRRSSAIRPEITLAEYRKFWDAILLLNEQHGRPITFREVARLMSLLSVGGSRQNALCTPFAILNIAVDGGFSTFCPELLTQKTLSYGGDFVLGNVLTDSLNDAARSPKAVGLARDIAAGVELCRKQCEYFSVCGGGAPSNKYYEHGQFAAAETAFCRFNRKSVVDAILPTLERIYCG
jgi:uncharacterized protein